MENKISNQDNNVKRDELQKASEPLIKYLCENHHPHVTVIVTPTSVELLDGVISIPKIFNYLVDSTEEEDCCSRCGGMGYIEQGGDTVDCYMCKGSGEPTIATDSTKCICPDDQCLLGNHPTCRYQPKKPTRKLVMQELIEWVNEQFIYEEETASDGARNALFQLVAEKIQSLKSKEIDNIKEAFWQGMRNGRSSDDVEKYFTQTYQPK